MAILGANIWNKKIIPAEVLDVGRILLNINYEAFVVGGCVRDLMLGKEPKDWDIATNALPEEVQKIFPESVYEKRYYIK